jgi:hypothetical protein
MSRRILLISMVCLVGACPSERPLEPIAAAWRDDFERASLGDAWSATAPDGYRVRGGALSAKGAYNHPLWLRRPLPADATIELDVWSMSPDGDLKLELYGDGRSYAKDRGQYTATGYVAIMGGWSNSISTLVAGNEHREDRPERRAPKVEVGKRYHWKLVKRGATVDWFVDDMATPFLSFTGEPPHRGPGFLGINNWQSDAWFDNLSITPL